MNKKLESRRATSNNNQGLSVGSPNNATFVNQSQNMQQSNDAQHMNRSGGGSPAQSLNNI